jgi:hypothetical protein
MGSGAESLVVTPLEAVVEERLFTVIVEKRLFGLGMILRHCNRPDSRQQHLKACKTLFGLIKPQLGVGGKP